MKQLLLTKSECEVIEKICRDEIFSLSMIAALCEEDIDSCKTIILNYEKLLSKVKEEQFLFNACELELIEVNLEPLVEVNKNSQVHKNLLEKVLSKINC